MSRATLAGLAWLIAAWIAVPKNAGAQVPLKVLHTFTGSTAPAGPYAPLVEASDGNFYGITFWGGAYLGGTAFRMTPSGVVTVLHEFNKVTEGSPTSSLLQASDGNFYGSTYYRGYGDQGTVFRMTPDGQVTLLGSPGGSALIEGTDGTLYGTSLAASSGDDGSVFRVTHDGVSKIHEFSSYPGTPEGYGPAGALLRAADGSFYGMTRYGRVNAGAVFRLTSTGQFETVHSFTGGADGAFPSGTLVQTSDGAIFGMTGGAYGSVPPMIFRIDRDLTFTVVHTFPSSTGSFLSGGLILGSDGAMYGTIGAALFRMTAAGDFSVIDTADGFFDLFSNGLSLGDDGNVYVTTPGGGFARNGRAFRVHTGDGTIDLIHDFPGGPDGGFPRTKLLQTADGNFYGTSGGGLANRGTLFVMSPAGRLTTLHAFNGDDGEVPAGALIRATDGNFYGTTEGGGAFKCGTIFRMNPSGAITTLHAFTCGADGDSPVGALVQATDGSLYGVTTLGGGAFRGGTAFKITLDGTLTTLHAFKAKDDGIWPWSGLIEGSDGNFYGVTLSSGDALYGTAYRMTPDGTVTVLHRLYRFDGDYSFLGVNGLIQARDGNFYGTTQGYGGTRGSLFRIAPNGTVTVLREFATDVQSPAGTLMQASDGNFYGVFGRTVSRLTPTGDLTVLHSFDYPASQTEGCCLSDSVIQAADGNLYGTTEGGGAYDAGTVFRLDVTPAAPAALTAVSAPDGIVKLAWSPAPAGTSYRVSRGSSAGSETLLASGITTTSFSDTTAVRGRRYYYVITAVNELGEGVNSYEVSITPGRAAAGDVDGDGKADLTVFRPSNGTWYTLQSGANLTTARGIPWGNAQDIPVSGDFDGDGKMDLAVFRPSDGTWYVLPSSTGKAFGVQWGTALDVPVPGDYDGDGKTDIAVFRPSNGTWYILKSSTNFTVGVGYAWGDSADVPVPGDYDGDGQTDIAVFRPSNGTWYILQSSTNFTVAVGYQWGTSTDTPVPGDYDGDGKTDLAVFRPSDGVWYVLRSSTNFTSAVGYQWGNAGDTPVAGDFDGDGRTDFAVFRPSNGTWYILQSSTNFAVGVGYQWGNGADIPVPRPR